MIAILAATRRPVKHRREIHNSRSAARSPASQDPRPFADQELGGAGVIDSAPLQGSSDLTSAVMLVSACRNKMFRRRCRFTNRTLMRYECRANHDLMELAQCFKFHNLTPKCFDREPLVDAVFA